MSKITCDVAKDIMPLFVDGICSENSKQLIEDHIKECQSCKERLEDYCNSSIIDEIKGNNEKEFKDLVLQVKKKSRKKTLLIVLGAVGISSVAYIIIFALAIGLLALNMNEKYRTIDISNYGIHEGHMEGEKSELWSGLYVFPEKVSEKAEDVTFFYSCGGASFDNKYQQFLKCTYTDEEYKVEIDRLKNVKCKIDVKNGIVINPVEYSGSKFIYPAYISAYGSHTTYEYALCNEDTKTIVYVYLQAISDDEVVFNKKYLPIEHQSGKQLISDNNWENINIYYCDEGNGVYKSFKD